MSVHTLRPASVRDAQQIASLYNYYVANTVVTFEEEPVDHADVAERIERVLATYPWLVAEIDDILVGYAYAAPWHARCAYRLSVETTVYVAVGFERRGIGTTLYAALLAELRRRKFHCAIGAIALPNDGSIALHERFGFRKVGQFRDIGFKLGRWIDVGYWQLSL